MKFLKNFWLFLLWLAVIIYLSFTPLSGWPKSNLFDKLYLDKIVHISLYAVMNFLLLRAIFKQQNLQSLRYPILVAGVIFCAGVGLVIEFLQPLLTMFRQFEWMDGIADMLGAVAGYLLYLSVGENRMSKSYLI